MFYYISNNINKELMDMDQSPRQELQNIIDRNTENEELLLRLLRCARAYEKALARSGVQIGHTVHHP